MDTKTLYLQGQGTQVEREITEPSIGSSQQIALKQRWNTLELILNSMFLLTLMAFSIKFLIKEEIEATAL